MSEGLAAEWTLVLQTASPTGFAGLASRGQLLEERAFGARRRHNLELMPTVAALCKNHQITPRELTDVFVCIGPGSFTGLRAGLACAQMLAITLPDIRLVPVPALDAITHTLRDAGRADTPTAVLLSRKREHAWATVIHGDHTRVPTGLHRLDALWSQCPRPLQVVADMPLELTEPGVTQLDVQWAVPRLASIYAVGQGCASVEASGLLPIYAREPEAVTLWQQRHGTAST